MNIFLKKIFKLNIGLMLYAVGITMTINANQGLSPWDVFHQGLSFKMTTTIGIASVLVSLTIVAFNYFLGEKVGWATLINSISIGVYIDILLTNKIIPIFNNLIFSYIMMFLGMFIIGIATFLYISVGWGSGPRDGLMIGLSKRFNLSIKIIRSGLETTALIFGFLMGGNVGFGTAIMAVTIGYFINFALKLFKFNITDIKHRYIEDDVKVFIKKITA